MTGQVALPDRTGPRPLLRPATAINTVGSPSPGSNTLYNMQLYTLHMCGQRKFAHFEAIYFQSEYQPSYSANILNVSSVPLWADVTLR